MTPRDLPPQIRERTVSKARTLVEALPFMREHFGKAIVVKYGGAAMESSGLARPFAEDVGLLREAGIRPVVVHGGSPQVIDLSSRPAPETINTQIVAMLNANGVPGVGLTGADGNLLRARTLHAPDLGFVGEVEGVHADVVQTLLDRRFVPVVASIAVDPSGQPYHVNADVVAAELAMALGAEKLVFISDVPGVIGPSGDLLSELGASDCRDLLARDGVIEGGMVQRLRSALRALDAGVGRVHVVDGRIEHTLVLELFTPEGVGTMIARDLPGAMP